MQVTLAHVGARLGPKDALEVQTSIYMDRCSAHARCSTEAFRTEDALLEWLDRQQGRTPVIAVLLDRRRRKKKTKTNQHQKEQKNTNKQYKIKKKTKTQKKKKKKKIQKKKYKKFYFIILFF